MPFVGMSRDIINRPASHDLYCCETHRSSVHVICRELSFPLQQHHHVNMVDVASYEVIYISVIIVQNYTIKSKRDEWLTSG